MNIVIYVTIRYLFTMRYHTLPQVTICYHKLPYVTIRYHTLLCATIRYYMTLSFFNLFLNA